MKLYRRLPLWASIMAYLLCAPICARCTGTWVNPIQDIDWNGFFPIRIGGHPIPELPFQPQKTLPDTPQPRQIWCFCKKPRLRLGLNIAYWEPIGIVDTSLQPFCLVGHGGITLPHWSSERTKRQQGTWGYTDPVSGQGFIWAHYYKYFPLLVFDFLHKKLCKDDMDASLLWASEWDASWNQEELSRLLSAPGLSADPPTPGSAEATLARHTACGVAPNSMSPPTCMGHHGRTFPANGAVVFSHHADTAGMLIAERVVAKLHQMRLMEDTGLTQDKKQARCTPQSLWMLPKTRYRIQRLFPVRADKRKSPCLPFGERLPLDYALRPYHTDIAGNFAYLIWRKRDCCLSIR